MISLEPTYDLTDIGRISILIPIGQPLFEPTLTLQKPHGVARHIPIGAERAVEDLNEALCSNGADPHDAAQVIAHARSLFTLFKNPRP